MIPSNCKPILDFKCDPCAENNLGRIKSISLPKEVIEQLYKKGKIKHDGVTYVIDRSSLKRAK